MTYYVYTLNLAGILRLLVGIFHNSLTSFKGFSPESPLEVVELIKDTRAC